ncbi:hypothetical protein V8E36_002096 [Tilletia maclaganii]
MISQKRKQPGNTPAASQKRARFAAGVSAGAQAAASSKSAGGTGSAGAAAIDGDLDLDEQDRKRTQQGRKGRVVTEGYDSDESAEIAEDDEDIEDAADVDEDDDADGVPKDSDDDEDMFAAGGDDSGDESKGNGKGKSKAKGKGKRGTGFLKSSQIEGQEFGETTRVGDGDEAEALSDEDDEDRDFDLELEDDDPGSADGDDDDDLEDDYNARAERTPSPLDGQPDDETDAAKQERRAARKAKAKKGMGHKLDSFNMRAEMQSGRFDEDGNYQANSADPHAQHDAWLSGNYSRKKIRAARDAQKKRDEEAQSREKETRSGGSRGGIGGTGAVTEVECAAAMLDFMDRGESVLETLQRLGKEAKQHSQGDSKAGKARKTAKYAGKGEAKRRALALDSESADGLPATEGMDVDSAPPKAPDPDEEATMASSKAPSIKAPAAEKHPSVIAVETFTALSSELMSNFGQINIYDETYEGILRALKRKGAVPAEWDPAAKRQALQKGEAPASTPSASIPIAAPLPAPQPPSQPDNRAFIYRWAPAYLAATQGANAAPDVETYGPFPVADLRGWAASGYFGAPGQCERILLKEAGPGTGQTGRWQSWKDSGL